MPMTHMLVVDIVEGFHIPSFHSQNVCGTFTSKWFGVSYAWAGVGGVVGEHIYIFYQIIPSYAKNERVA